MNRRGTPARYPQPAGEVRDGASPMSKLFEELDYRVTPMGALSLWRRRDLARNVDIYEIRLGDDYLMSSRFTEAETALATLALDALRGRALDVVVGGLGLGYTAEAVLTNPAVRSLHVIEALPEVIEWHQRGLLPLGAGLTSDARCRLVAGDFFALLAAPDGGFDPDRPGRRFDAVLVDIDHSPQSLLHPSHAAFYRPEGLRGLARHLRSGGVFGLWSNDPPEDAFLAALAEAFATAEARVVRFPAPSREGEAANTVYLARAH